VPAAAQPERRVVLRPPDAVASTEFAWVTSIREVKDGSVLVADQGAAKLFLVRWNTPETVIGRTGAGPGEFSAVGRLYALAGDSTLFTDSYTSRWLLLQGARIVATLSEQGSLNRLLKSTLSGADDFGHVLGTSGAVYTGLVPHSAGVADSLLLLLADRKSQRVDILARLKGTGSAGYVVRKPQNGRPGRIISSSPLASHDQALLFHDGWIALAWLKPYRVDWRSPNGRWIRGAPLPFSPIKVDDREKCAAMARWFGAAGPFGAGGACDPASLPGWPEIIPPFLPTRPLGSGPATALFAMPDGRLLIARTPTSASPQHSYDVIDRAGRLTASFSLGANESVIGFGTRALYTLTTGEAGVQALRRHPWP
jgi:hypothetical protein